MICFVPISPLLREERSPLGILIHKGFSQACAPGCRLNKELPGWNHPALNELWDTPSSQQSQKLPDPRLLLSPGWKGIRSNTIWVIKVVGCLGSLRPRLGAFIPFLPDWVVELGGLHKPINMYTLPINMYTLEHTKRKKTQLQYPHHCTNRRRKILLHKIRPCERRTDGDTASGSCPIKTWGYMHAWRAFSS